MSVILVAEQDASYATRIAEALAAEGWTVRTVDSRDAAIASASAQAPRLLLVSAALPEATTLLASFSQRSGGPGTVVLVPSGTIGRTAADYQADELLTKPFSDDALKRTVRRCLESARNSRGSVVAAPRPPSQQLTSNDIFGDVLAEVEAEAQRARSARRARGAAAASATGGDDIERKLEETLSGVLAIGGKLKRPATTPDAVPKKLRSRAEEAEIDDLLDKTLSSLELPGLTKKTAAARPASPPPAAAPAVRSAPPPAATAPPPPPADAAKEQLAPLPAFVDEPTPEFTPPPPLPDLEPPELLPVDFPATDFLPDDTAADLTPADFTPDFDDAEPDAAAAPAPVGEEPSLAPRFGQPAPPPDAFEPPADELGAAAFELDPLGGFDDDIYGHGDTFDFGSRSEVAPPAPTPAAPPPRGARSFLDQADPSDVFGGPAATLQNVLEVRGDVFKTQRLPTLPAPAAADDEPRATGGSQTFGDYTLLERIAVGGMAEVWRARRRGVEGFQKTVAIKKILSHLTDSHDFVNMFIDEAKLAAQLSHNNIIQIYDLGKVGDDFFIAMEYVEGRDLRSILRATKEQGERLPLGLGLTIIAALARALDYAHRKRDFDDRDLGLVHRDVSPQNVLISYEGEIKLCDFGIVKAVSKASTTQMGALKGKLQYMSPEQAWGKPVDARSDIFSLGSVLFEVLTGTKLFTGDSEISVLDAVRECRIRSPREINPEVPDAVDRVVRRALAKTPEERYTTAGAMEHDIKAVLDTLKPTPSPKELGAYLSALFAPAGDLAAAGAPASGGALASGATTAPGVPPTAPDAGAYVPPPLATAAAATDTGTAGVPAAVKPTGGGKGGRWLLAAVVAGALAAALAAFLLLRDGAAPDGAPAPAPPPAAAAPVDAGTLPESGEDGAPAADAVAPEGEQLDLERLVTEEVTKKKEQLDREFEEEKKRLEQELARIQAQERATPPPDGGP